MSILVDTLMEKHAFSLGGAWSSAKGAFNNLGPVQKYKQVAASTPFKIKKRIGQAAIVAAPTAYGAHWLDKSDLPQPGSQT
jgi:hypothetical protein